ncbi:MAG: two-component regulator propeller domain-containing protein [Bacteroidota bacterium]
MKLNYSFLPLYALVFTVFLVISCKGKQEPLATESKTADVSDTTKNIREVTPYVVTDSIVRSIYEDTKGNLWIGRVKTGLSKWNGETMTHFSMKDGLADNQVRTIQEDQAGNMWFATGNGVSKYDGQQFTSVVSNLSFPAVGFTRNNWPAKTDGLWFNGEKEGGIYHYDGKMLSVYDFPELPEDHESFSIKGTVTGISHGKRGVIWMANYGGVIGYNGVEFTYINERRFKYHVRSLHEDSKGRLWIGNNGIGVLLYDGDTTINFSKQQKIYDVGGSDGGGLSPQGTLNHVFSITEDLAGNIWFGDRDTGLWKYDGTGMTNYGFDDGISNTFVCALHTDRKGNLLIGLGNGDVFRYDGVSFEKMF